MDDHREDWYKLDEETRQEIVVLTRSILDYSGDEVERILANPNWLIQTHFTYGMWVRNEFRQAGFTDDKLPPTGDNDYGNWDDYYIAAVEATLGIIPL